MELGKSGKPTPFLSDKERLFNDLETSLVKNAFVCGQLKNDIQVALFDQVMYQMIIITGNFN